MKLHAIVTFALALAAFGCRAAAPPDNASNKPAEPATPTIDVVRVVEQPVAVTLSIPGELNPYQSVAIYPRVAGFVKTIRVDRGSAVRAGETIANLEAPELTAQRSEAESKLQAAEAQLGAVRSKADADGLSYANLKAASATPGVVAGNDVMLAEKAVEGDLNQVKAAEQNVAAARQAVASIKEMEGYLTIEAPFDGVVTERNVHPGALVGPTGVSGASSPMLRVVQTRRLRLVVPVPEAYIAGLKSGAMIPFSVAAYPGQSFSGRLARIAQAVDVNTRTMAVELDVDNQNGQLAPGAFCQVRWPVHRPGSSLMVPSGSVANTTGRVFVVRIRDGRTEWVDVKTGLTTGPLLEVFGDLQAGDEIVARATDEMPAGTQVRIREPKPA